MSQGLQYIHFLKSPPSCVALNQPFKVVLTITNDLTDAKSHEETPLQLKVYDGHWRAFDGIRLKDGSTSVTFNPYNGGFCGFEASFTQLPPCGTQTVRLAAHAVSSLLKQPHSAQLNLLKATVDSNGLLIPVWTTDIRVTKDQKLIPTSENQQQCERRLWMKSGRVVRILEDKQESIARHLWYSIS
jgi:hypothetical protein